MKFETSEGRLRDGARSGHGAAGCGSRLQSRPNAGFYDDVRFFRVLDNFMAQFGINGDPKVSASVAAGDESSMTRFARATREAW